jgi:hypothetical protein
MKVGDLVKVTAKELRIPLGSVGVVTRVEEREDSSGTTVQYWAHMVKSGFTFWFRLEALEVISASR